MEGDLLGLGLEQPTVSNKTLPEVQLFESGFLPAQQPPSQVLPQSQFPVAATQQTTLFSNAQQPAAQHQQVPAVGQQLQFTVEPIQATTTSSNNIDPTIGSTVTTKSTAHEVWKPSPLHDEPKNPVLREIKEKFSGRWKLIRSDPYDEYLKAAGVGFIARKLAISRDPEQEIAIKGNKIHIDFRSTFHNQIHVFMLEESLENVVETTRQSVFCSYKDGKLILLMTPLDPGLNRTQEVERDINQYGELVVMYTCGTATCRRYFARMADIVAPLNIVG
ncbi:hypothetical protein BsWGS_21658 [Bradybaena similaris]